MQGCRRTDKKVARYPLAVLIWQTFAAGIRFVAKLLYQTTERKSISAAIKLYRHNENAPQKRGVFQREKNFYFSLKKRDKTLDFIGK